MSHDYKLSIKPKYRTYRTRRVTTVKQSSIFLKNRSTNGNLFKQEIDRRPQPSQLDLITMPDMWGWNTVPPQQKLQSLPVYVDEVDGEERIVYHSKKMKANVMYKIRWLGERFALRKASDGKVNFYEFEPKQN